MILALIILLSGSPASAADLDPTTHARTTESSSIVEAPLCVPSDICSDLPPACTIPQEHCEAALFVHDFVRSHNYSPPPGYKGGSQYLNTNGQLPPGGDYLEYRIYTAPSSAERLVFDRNTGEAWFSGDHYASFTEFMRVIRA